VGGTTKKASHHHHHHHKKLHFSREKFGFWWVEVVCGGVSGGYQERGQSKTILTLCFRHTTFETLKLVEPRKGDDTEPGRNSFT
jgi:hypothetical protein